MDGTACEPAAVWPKDERSQDTLAETVCDGRVCKRGRCCVGMRLLVIRRRVRIVWLSIPLLRQGPRGLLVIAAMMQHRIRPEFRITHIRVEWCRAREDMQPIGA